MDEPNELLAELREQTRLLRLIAMPELKRLIRELLKEDSERLAFELSDGKRSTRDIAPSVGVSAKSISNWWQKWTAAGIATADAKGHVTRITSLASIGVAVPRGASSPATPGAGEDVADG